MLVFAAVHLYWAFGGGGLLPAGFSVPDNAALFVIDVLAVPLCLGGAAVAFALTFPHRIRVPRRVLLGLGWVISALALAHSLPTMVSHVGRLLGVVDSPGSAYERFSAYLYEPWWFLGGVLFGALVWRAQRDGRSSC